MDKLITKARELLEQTRSAADSAEQDYYDIDEYCRENGECLEQQRHKVKLREAQCAAATTLRLLKEADAIVF